MAQDDTDLSEYTVKINGLEHTMMLNEEDAARYGDDAQKASSTTASQAATAPEPDTKSQPVADKARTASNK